MQNIPGLSFLAPAEAAQILGITTKTLANWRCLSRGPNYVKVGRLVRYMRKDIAEYATKRCVETQANS